MKKYIAALLTALLLLCTALSAGAVGPALTTTEAYCIIDADTGLVLAQQNMNEELHPASITKVMTLGLACQKAQGNWDGVKLTVSHEDVYSSQAPIPAISPCGRGRKSPCRTLFTEP